MIVHIAPIVSVARAVSVLWTVSIVSWPISALAAPTEWQGEERIHDIREADGSNDERRLSCCRRTPRKIASVKPGQLELRRGSRLRQPRGTGYAARRPLGMADRRATGDRAPLDRERRPAIQVA